MSDYDVAQVCPNGHVTNDSSRDYPAQNMEFCDRCGEKTITACPHCREPIRGAYSDSYRTGNYRPPAYCHKCGGEFPWTERKSRAAIELFIEESGSTGEQAQEFEQAVHDIVRDTPQTPVASRRFLRAMTKVTKETAGAIRDVLVDVVSEAAKKMIWPT